MIELWQFPPAFGLMNPSPFCMKVEVFLRLAGLPYRCKNDALPFKAPKGKLPLIRDTGEDDRQAPVVVPDSQAIVTHLQQRYRSRIHPALIEPDTAAQHALRRMLEEHSYFAIVWLRWVDPAYWPQVKPIFFSRPPVIGPLVGELVRRKMRRDLLGQGMGRHTPSEIAARVCADIDALDAALGEQPYFGGAHPAAFDACAYAFLANLLWPPLDMPPKHHAQSRPRLVAYAERMQDRVGRA